ncbi:hypothetical protein AB0D71_33735 [Streptomyces avermitilis]
MLSPLVKYRNSGAAILRDGGGTELLLAERPWDGQYLVAPCFHPRTTST